MNTRKVKQIIKFDVERSIQNKWFVILNIVIFIGILVTTNWSNISKYMKEHNINIFTEDNIKLQIVDEENLFYDDFVAKYSESESFEIEKVSKNSYSKSNIPDDNVVLVEVKKDETSIVSAKIVSKEGLDSNIYDLVHEALKETRNKVFAQNNGIDLETLNILNEDVNLERELLGVDAENSNTKEMIKMISIVIVYMVLIFVLSRIASEIAQEKVSKSIEYVLTSVSEKEYLLAKVLGSTITILIQVLYTFVYYIIGNMISSLFATKLAGVTGGTITTVDSSIVSYVLAMCAYLIFTVFLTTLIQAALSSKTTSVAEAGNTTMFLMSIIIILYFISLSAISPYITVSPFMYVISCLPLVSTFFIPAMMIIGQATTAQIIISFIVLIGSVPLIFDVCAKHFKNGILDYTSSNKKKKLFGFVKKEKKEMDLKEKQEYDLRVRKSKKFAFTIGMAMILLIVLETVFSFICQIAFPSLLGNKLAPETLLVLENSIILIIALGITSVFIKFYLEDESKEEIKESQKEKPKEEVKVEAKEETKNELKDKAKEGSSEIININKAELIFIGIALLAIIQLFLNWLYPKIGLDYNIFDSVNMVSGKGVLANIIFVLGMAVVPAVFEEILFRKIILNYSKRYGNIFAIVFSAVLFGLYHMNLNQGIFAFIIGIMFAIITLKTGNIKMTMLLHFLNNGYACMIGIFGEESIVFELFNNIVIAIAIFGTIILIRNLPKLKEIKKEYFTLNKDCKFLIRNYTFIISMFLLVVMFVATENLLR